MLIYWFVSLLHLLLNNTNFDIWYHYFYRSKLLGGGGGGLELRHCVYLPLQPCTKQLHFHTVFPYCVSILYFRPILALAMEVELLINAHHCQTLACNTEGISSILKLAQLCTHALAEANEYQQMVKYLSIDFVTRPLRNTIQNR